VVAAADIGIEDLLPGALHRGAAEMHDGIAAFDRRHHCRVIGQIKGDGLFIRRKVGDAVAAGQTQLPRQRRKTAAQFGAKAPCGAGDQDGIVTRGHLASERADTARPIRAIASVSTASEVAVEMRKKGDSP